MFEELEISTKFGGIGGFLPGMKQIANVAALPGIVGVSVRFFVIKNQFCLIFFSSDPLVYLMFIQDMVSQLVIWLHLIIMIQERLYHPVVLDLILIVVYVYYEQILVKKMFNQ
jgi:hypothetical protein